MADLVVENKDLFYFFFKGEFRRETYASELMRQLSLSITQECAIIYQTKSVSACRYRFSRVSNVTRGYRIPKRSSFTYLEKGRINTVCVSWNVLPLNISVISLDTSLLVITKINLIFLHRLWWYTDFTCNGHDSAVSSASPIKTICLFVCVCCRVLFGDTSCSKGENVGNVILSIQIEI